MDHLEHPVEMRQIKIFKIIDCFSQRGSNESSPEDLSLCPNGRNFFSVWIITLQS